jgi:hypothetical protein
MEPLERVFELLTACPGEPEFHSTAEWRGFRYKAPDVRHFCPLKAARAISAMHAAIELARKGFTQEVAVLMRTLIECTTHIEFVIQVDASDKEKAVAKQYIEAYFADSQRGVGVSTPRAPIQQGEVHTSLGKMLDRYAELADEAEGRVSAEN